MHLVFKALDKCRGLLYFTQLSDFNQKSES